MNIISLTIVNIFIIIIITIIIIIVIIVIIIIYHYYCYQCYYYFHHELLEMLGKKWSIVPSNSLFFQLSELRLCEQLLLYSVIPDDHRNGESPQILSL